MKSKCSCKYYFQKVLFIDMGSTSVQHRVAIGCYASRLGSSGWSPGSSGRARRNGSCWRKRRSFFEHHEMLRLFLHLIQLVVISTPFLHTSTLGPHHHHSQQQHVTNAVCVEAATGDGLVLGVVVKTTKPTTVEVRNEDFFPFNLL